MAAETIVDSKLRDQALVLSVLGALTMENTDALRAAALAKLASCEPIRGLVVDLSACEYLDSTGIGAFIVLKMRFKQAGRFRLCAPMPLVRRIFTATRFDLVVPIDKTLEESLASLPAEAVAP